MHAALHYHLPLAVLVCVLDPYIDVRLELGTGACLFLVFYTVTFVRVSLAAFHEYTTLSFLSANSGLLAHLDITALVS